LEEKRQIAGNEQERGKSQLTSIATQTGSKAKESKPATYSYTYTAKMEAPNSDAGEGGR
jgi:hypothetical protein